MNEYREMGKRLQSNLNGKRIVLLALGGLFAPLVAHAGTYGDLTYTSDGSAITITDCAVTATNVVVPATIESLPVTSIGNYAFFINYSLTNVSLSNGITKIGGRAFFDCTNLTSMAIPNSVASIDEGAFFNCGKLTSLTISSNVTHIGAEAFRGWSSLPNISVDPANSFYSSQNGILFNKNQTMLHQCPAGKAGSYAIPGTVTNIVKGAFNSTSLTNVAIPASVIDIGDWAFEWSTILATITVNAANPSFSSQDGVLFNKDQTRLIQYPGGKTNSSYTISNSVVDIGGGAFSFSYHLSDIAIPNTVTNIGPGAFRDCLGFTSITIPDSVVSVEWMSFYNCTNLSRLYFTGNIPSVSSSTFSGADNVTIYYLPGTAGWEPTFGRRPTALWNPGMQLGDGYGATTNGFSFNISGTVDIPIAVEACTNLVKGNWFPLQTTNLTSGSLDFTDPDWTNYPSRVYRIAAP